MRKQATVGQRVANNKGHEGTITELRRGEVLVKWDDGFHSWILAEKLHPVRQGMRWGPALACAMLLVIALTVLIFG